MQARYYDPVIGRFYSNDPIGFRDVHSFNRYVYANNNPYKYVDPDGNESMFAFHADLDVRALGSGSISRSEYSARVDGRISGSRVAAEFSPIGRAALTVVRLAEIVFGELGVVKFEGETDSEDLSAEEINAIAKENKQEAIDRAVDAYQDGSASNVDGDVIGRETKETTEKNLDDN